MTRSVPSEIASCLVIALVACNGGEDPDPDVCGDGVVGPTEACDDGNRWFADGCTPDCSVEEGPFETEPNDSPADSTPWPGSPVTGRLVEGDVDCFSFDVGRCDAVQASLVGECPRDVVLSLYDENGSLVASGPEAADGCARVDPTSAPGARWLLGPTATVCARTVLGTPVAGYTLDVTTGPSTVVAGESDLDFDGLPDWCDDDRDGDLVLDEVDNCPTVPNGPEDGRLVTNNNGFIRNWLVQEPVPAIPGADGCLPEPRAGDGSLSPSVGEPDWIPIRSNTSSLRSNVFFGDGPSPGETYLHTYVVFDQARTATLRVGTVDSFRAWLDGQPVIEASYCGGSDFAIFEAPVTLVAGLNRLTFQVYDDDSGNWSLSVRFRDELDVPITDYTISLSADGSPYPSQSDIDSDGVGDACDSSPAG